VDTSDLVTTKKNLIGAAAIIAAFLALINGYSWYMNNIWHPEIKIVTIDYKKGVAELLVNGKKFGLKGNSAYLIGYDWGVRFGTTHKGGVQVYDRIEVLKRNMVHAVLKNSEDIT
jgi:hypothetical protein